MEVSSAHCPPGASGVFADTQTDKPGKTALLGSIYMDGSNQTAQGAMHVHGSVRKEDAFSLLSQGYSGIIYKQ